MNSTLLRNAISLRYRGDPFISEGQQQWPLIRE